MKPILWHEWSKNFPDRDLASHPLVIELARNLSYNRAFLAWMGHDHPVVMSIEPVALIAVAILCRIRVRWGAFEDGPVTIPCKADRLDETVGVPGLFESLWQAGLVQSTGPDRIILSAPDGSFPPSNAEVLETTRQAEKRKELAAIRHKLTLGMTMPQNKHTHPGAYDDCA